MIRVWKYGLPVVEQSEIYITSADTVPEIVKDFLRYMEEETPDGQTPPWLDIVIGEYSVTTALMLPDLENGKAASPGIPLFRDVYHLNEQERTELTDDYSEQINFSLTVLFNRMMHEGFLRKMGNPDQQPLRKMPESEGDVKAPTEYAARFSNTVQVSPDDWEVIYPNKKVTDKTTIGEIRDWMMKNNYHGTISFNVRELE